VKLVVTDFKIKNSRQGISEFPVTNSKIPRHELLRRPARTAWSTHLVCDRAGVSDDVVPYPIEGAKRNLEALSALAAPVDFPLPPRRSWKPHHQFAKEFPRAGLRKRVAWSSPADMQVIGVQALN
jgi:hypothetical protein